MSTCRSLSQARWGFAGILVSTLLGVPPVAAQPAIAALDEALTSVAMAQRDQHVRVIVRVHPERRESVATLVRRAGHTLHRTHTLMSALTVELPANAMQALARQPGVESISIDAPVAAQQVIGAPSRGGQQPSALQQTLGITGVAARTRGRGVGVAIIDSGIAPSPDFGNRIRGFYDFTNGGVATLPFDDHGHGTHVAGLVGGAVDCQTASMRALRLRSC